MLHLPQCLTGDGRTPKEVGALPIIKSFRFPASPYLLEECLNSCRESRAVADVILHQLLQLLQLLHIQQQNWRTGGLLLTTNCAGSSRPNTSPTAAPNFNFALP